MNPAVSLVRAYFSVNGFFVETEFPIVARAQAAGVRSVTDIDLLAVRFPRAYRYVPEDARDAAESPSSRFRFLDPLLDLSGDDVEFFIGEVKEGRAELNRGSSDPNVLRAALARFGAFSHDEISRVIDDLLHKGDSRAASGRRVRIVAVGSSVPDPPPAPCTILTHGQIVRHLLKIWEQHSEVARAMQFGDPSLATLMILLKSGVKIDVPERKTSSE